MENVARFGCKPKFKKMKSFRFIIPLIVFLGCIYLFAFQPQILLVSVFEGKSIPLGTLVSWLGLIAFVYFFYLILPFNVNNSIEKILKRILVLGVYLSLFWGIVSYFLLGNWGFNFDNSTYSMVWIVLTCSIVLIPVFLTIVFVLLRLFRK